MSLVKKLLKPAGIATLATALTLSGLGLKTTPHQNNNQNTSTNSKYNIELTLGPEEAYAGGEYPIDQFFTDIKVGEKGKVTVFKASLGNKSFLDLYSKSPLLQRLIPKEVVRDANDGRFDNYEGRGIRLAYDGRLCMKLKNAPDGQVFIAYTDPLSKADQDAVGREIDKYIFSKQ